MRCFLRQRRTQTGFSLIEVLVVVTILIILSILAIQVMAPNLLKSYDGRRKSDLAKIKVAFEEYYNDKECYPPSNILQNCGSQDLQPYLKTVFCDPQTKEPYLYLPEGGACPGGPTVGHTGGFRVLAALEYSQDLQSKELNCGGAQGCGAGLGLEKYNYGVSVGVPVGKFVGENGPIDHSTDTICCVDTGVPVCNVIPMGGSCAGNRSYQTYEACIAAGCL